jgi:hypothetical protein
MGGSPGLQTNLLELIVRMIHPAFCRMSGDALRARPPTLHSILHLHFYIRDADADARKCPTQLGIMQMWMKKFPRGVEFPTFSRFMQGACYQLKTNNFRKVLEMIG